MSNLLKYRHWIN